MFAALDEVEVGTGEEIDDGARDEDFARSGEGRDPLRGVNGDAGDVVASEFDFTRVEPRAYLDAQCLDRVTDRACTSNRAPWSVERREDTVTGELDDPASEPIGFFADDSVVGDEEFPPAPVALRSGLG